MVAFVVGIGDYKHHPKLPKPVTDAEAIRDVLEKQNAEVYFAENCGVDEFEEAFALFLAAVQPGDAVFLFFAGHGAIVNNAMRLITISNSSKSGIVAASLNLDVLVARSAPQTPVGFVQSPSMLCCVRMVAGLK